MRKAFVALVAVAAFALAAGPAQAQLPRHTHPLETPGGHTATLAPGVSFHAPCTAFVNFHFNVHRGVFGVSGAGPNDVEGKHPLGPIEFTMIMPPEFCELP